MKRRDYSGLFLHHGLIALIIIYFSLHGYVAHYGSVVGSEVLLLSLLFLVLALLTRLGFKRIFRKEGKATAFTAIFLLIILFFGVFQDIITGMPFVAVLGRLTIFFSASVAFLIICYLIIKKSGSDFRRLRKFLTTLLFIYLVVDLFHLTQLANGTSASEIDPRTSFTNPAIPGIKPSVYLILLDEYAGNEALETYYNYPNRVFKNFLEEHGFHIVSEPRSNYDLTIYSMASMFQMDYLANKGPAIISNHFAYKQALRIINKNTVSDQFGQLGYRVINKSPFYFYGQAPAYSTGLLPDKLNLVQHQTMYYRVAKALPDLMAREFGLGYFLERNARLADINHEQMMQEVLRETAKNDTGPTFTYLHLMMPHDPLVHDSLGNRMDVTQPGFGKDAKAGDAAYLQYLVYTNRRISRFIDSLQHYTKGKAVVMVMSDHGARHLSRINKNYAYNNLHAVYLPDRDYKLYNRGTTNVNTFPLLFRSIFGINIEIRADSIAN